MSKAPAQFDLIERLYRSLAFHCVESELTLSQAEGDCSNWLAECGLARELIKESGHDIDQLYPPSERPEIVKPQ